MYFMIGTPNSLSDLRSLHRDYSAANRPAARIAVIDDEDFPYASILQRHNFVFKWFKDIEDVQILHQFPIVLCDIRGVGKHFESQFEGAHLLSEIRKHFPAKTLIAYTGQQYDARYNNYLNMADLVLKKDIDSDQWVECLDNAIRNASDPVVQWRRLRSYLLDKDVSVYNVMRLEHEYVRKVLDSKREFPTKKSLSLFSEDIQQVLIGFGKSLLGAMVAK